MDNGSPGLITGNLIAKRLKLSKDSQNVLPASNTCAVARASIIDGNIKGFSGPLLPIREDLARASWEAATTAIGRGLVRPEIFLQTRADPIFEMPPNVVVRKASLGGGFKYFLFSPLPGEMIQFDLRIFFRWVGSKPPPSFKSS